METKAFALFAFINVMYMDVRMPQAQDAQDAQERRICGLQLLIKQSRA